MKTLVAASILAMTPLAGFAAPVDLTGWIDNGFQGDNSSGNWVVQPGNDAVRQTINGDPTVFFDPGSNAQGTSLAGEITVETTSDDDFIGFVLGYQDGELNSANADFWLIDWKQATQSFGGETAQIGLSLSHVSGDILNGTTDPFDTFWPHAGYVNEVQRAATLGSTGWVDNALNEFELIFTADLIQVSVDGNVELSYTSADNGGVQFTDGAFGFYNFSQDPVLYAGITENVLPDPDPVPDPDPAPVVPLPASSLLLMGGIAGLVGMRRRKR